MSTTITSPCLDLRRSAILGEREATILATAFKALADPTRVRLIGALTGGERCVGDLAEALGMSVSAVSHQLGMLRRLRVVKGRREGRHVHYSLADEHIARVFEYALEHALEI